MAAHWKSRAKQLLYRRCRAWTLIAAVYQRSSHQSCTAHLLLPESPGAMLCMHQVIDTKEIFPDLCHEFPTPQAADCISCARRWLSRNSRPERIGVKVAEVALWAMMRVMYRLPSLYRMSIYLGFRVMSHFFKDPMYNFWGVHPENVRLLG